MDAGGTNPMTTEHYDAIVIGSGPGGGITAGVLCEAGFTVLLLERGQDRSFDQIGRDHLRNQRISIYGHNAGPDIEGNPRVVETTSGTSGSTQIVKPHQGGYSNNAAIFGGGARVYGAQAWRFMEQDFQMATHYGTPEGSSLADWPISYADLEPYYELAEREIGVSGNADANKKRAWRASPYPMPALPATAAHHRLKAGADALGWNTFPTPLAINSVEYDGRPACVQCQHCVGFACPSNSKNGVHNTLLPRALKTGLCTVKTGAMCESIDTNSQGKVTGVSYLLDIDGKIERRTAHARAVVVSAGAIETARLLLNSKSKHHPDGLGNHSGNVGRHLQGHVYSGAMGLFDDPVWDSIGPGVSISTSQFNHGNAGIVGGGMLSDEFIKLPIIFWHRCFPADVPHWGKTAKDWMRHAYTRTLHVIGPIQDIPNPNCMVTTDGSVRDRYGIPVAHLSGAVHPESLRAGLFMFEKAREWLRASGAVKIWGEPPGSHLSAGQHQAGTCRMGNDPAVSVTDSFGRVHDLDNLRIIDASTHVTNGGFNPVLTVMALSFRNASRLAEELGQL
jgi:choline dehydrogenase-like flavoprotein